MQPDLLQQLRDIHMPLEPQWWPPAPGWWLLAAALVFGCVLAARFALQYRRQRLPIKRARQLYADLHQRHRAGEVPAETYVHESNELLKRLLIHGLGIEAARPISDSAWLALLDEHYGSPAFSGGPGRILGNERFHRDPTIQVEPLHTLLTNFLRKVQP
jgi:hypothetical protein